jgi:hypothetical protein
MAVVKFLIQFSKEILLESCNNRRMHNLIIAVFSSSSSSSAFLQLSVECCHKYATERVLNAAIEPQYVCEVWNLKPEIYAIGTDMVQGQKW